MDFFGFSFLLCGCPSAAYLRVCGVLSISSSSLAYINFCPFPLLFAPLPILHFTFPFDFNDPLTFFQSFAPSTLISPPLLLPFPLFIAPHTYLVFHIPLRFSTLPLLCFNPSPLRLLFRPPCFYPSRYFSTPFPILYFSFPFDFQRSLYSLSIFRPFASYFTPLLLPLPLLFAPP